MRDELADEAIALAPTHWLQPTHWLHLAQTAGLTDVLQCAIQVGHRRI